MQEAEEEHKRDDEPALEDLEVTADDADEIRGGLSPPSPPDPIPIPYPNRR
jgi:hypothetical protein